MKWLLLLICCFQLHAQYFATNQDRYFEYSGIRIDVQYFAPVGQSFIAATNATGWVDFRIADKNPTNSLSGTLHVDLREYVEDFNTHVVSGSVIASSAPVTVPDSFAGRIRFTFQRNVPLVKGKKYWWHLIWESGDPVYLSIYHWNYEDVDAIFQGATNHTIDDAAYAEGVIEYPKLTWLTQSNQMLGLNATGRSNLNIILQQSNNFTNWISLSTNAGGSATLDIPLSESASFFRAIYAPNQ